MPPRLVDYFEVLGINPTASNEEVRKRFQALAKALHPDVNSSPDAAARFHSVKEAYDVLRNPSARRSFEARRKATAGIVYYDPTEAASIAMRAHEFQRRYKVPCMYKLVCLTHVRAF
jgi:curved DNA-binding protein CbpA